MYFATLFTLLAVVAARSPPDLPATCTGYVICVDAINDCGDSYGGCYDACSEKAPTAPPCTTTAPTTTPTSPPPHHSPTGDCRTRTVCVDAINECGIPYGGCIPDCKPWKLSTPPCPTPKGMSATAQPTVTAYYG